MATRYSRTGARRTPAQHKPAPVKATAAKLVADEPAKAKLVGKKLAKAKLVGAKATEASRTRVPAGRYGSGPSRPTRILLWVAAGWAVLLALALAAVVLASLHDMSGLLIIAGGLGVGALLALANLLRRTATRDAPPR